MCELDQVVGCVGFGVVGCDCVGDVVLVLEHFDVVVGVWEVLVRFVVGEHLVWYDYVLEVFCDCVVGFVEVLFVDVHVVGEVWYVLVGV